MLGVEFLREAMKVMKGLRVGRASQDRHGGVKVRRDNQNSFWPWQFMAKAQQEISRRRIVLAQSGGAVGNEEGRQVVCHEA
ncbi:hypothetical protein HY29_15245 [Hyphomonas beringensis]|uniref:Uncharacterized protein n=1 Tax=Hyphomonas beringensis TaxID=1280946 RepID=A0A062U7F9_9PROT|nr:hypothetical protein HY29_15245 [Hyphomonas beringensis]